MPGQIPKTAQKSQTQTPPPKSRGGGKLCEIENWIALWSSAGDANGFEGEGTWSRKAREISSGWPMRRRGGLDPFAEVAMVIALSLETFGDDQIKPRLVESIVGQSVKPSAREGGRYPA